MAPIRIPLLILGAFAVTALSGCIGGPNDAEIFGTATGGTLTPGVIKQEGSSTVLPLAEVWAAEFGTARDINFQVDGGGSGRGATGLCKKQLDLGDMSRQMRASEKTEVCAPNGVTPLEFKIAFDGLSVVVSKQNTFVQDLSVEQLEHIFRGAGFAARWNEVDPTFPDRPIQLCYPDGDSGTYEYFGEEILDGADPRTGQGVSQSSDDNFLVTCLQGNADAIGYFGFAYLKRNEGTLRAVSVNGVSPTFESIADGTYTPLGRPIYIYTNGVPQGLLADYFRYVLHPEGGQRLIEGVGYVALDENTRLSMLNQL